MSTKKFAVVVSVIALFFVSISLALLAGTSFTAQETDTGLILNDNQETSIPFYDRLTQMGISEQSQKNFTFDLLAYGNELNADGSTHILMNNLFTALTGVWQTTEFQAALEINDIEAMSKIVEPVIQPYRLNVDLIFNRTQRLLDRNKISSSSAARRFTVRFPGVEQAKAKTVLCIDQRPLPKPFDKWLPGWCLGGKNNGSPWEGGDSLIGPGGRPIIKWGDNAFGKPGVAIQPSGGNWGISGTIVPSLQPQGRDRIKPNIDLGGGSGGIWIAPGDRPGGIIIGGSIRF